ncbi:leucyl aminopeptidase [Microlunatus parietis]|uniref:Probable cytosol aminopeptidase n=1 Tax=Microlunatus parietis TaxID=682979 RepID=A0A7Y9I6E2_9ACTN|nr:leucyl aminopeptidase [Microlunatus parietis]NYE70885.1 leucyl aminopeptidase [Microlunatus parietis]
MPAPTLPSIDLAKTLPRSCDVLIVGLGGAGAIAVPEAIERAQTKRYGVSVTDLARSVGAKSDEGKTAILPAAGDGPRLLIIGLGDSDPTPEGLRKLAGAAVRQAGGLAEEASLSIALALPAEDPETLQAIAEGALLGSYRYQPISSKVATAQIDQLTVINDAKLTGTGPLLDRARTIAAAVAQAREWVNLPPNLLYPDSLAEDARALVRDARVTVEVLDDKALQKGGYGGIMAVGGGSSRPPRLVRYGYTPRGAKAHLALVGKGITFDSGGLNLKPGDSMYTMKSDMAGAAAVLAAVSAIARLGLRVTVTAYAALAENLPSDTSYRPSDVLTMYGGKTVENGNTDAEGRLVMADALVRAGEDKPDLIVDVATLTGACVVALGNRTSGLMATDDETADRVLDAAEAAGESFWQLPIPAEFRAKLDSKVADLRSTATDRAGGALTAAAFLREFVAEGVSWAHLDIAGPSFNSGEPYGYTPAGGTGVAVRTLIALAEAMQD